jgi:hypothetical protein
MENLEDIIYSRGITAAKKKLNFARKKPAKDKKKITFKSKNTEVPKKNLKTTLIIKRKNIPINIEEISKSMEKLKILPKNSIIIGKDMYYVDKDGNNVPEEYIGEKVLRISFPRCTKVTSNVTDKKDIPVRFLNAFGRLKNKSMMHSYDDKFHCWNSISEKSKNHWKMLSYSTDTLERMLLSNGTEATLLWCHLFS